MFQGQAYRDVVTSIQAQVAQKKDLLLTPSQHIQAVKVDGEGVKLRIRHQGETLHYEVGETAHRQFADRLQIPLKFYNLLRKEKPDLLVHNINELILEETDERLIRTIGSRVRAYLSDTFRRLDNFDLAVHLLPVLREVEGLVPISSSITEDHLNLKYVTPKIEDRIREGDVVQYGISIQNSEVGLGMLRVEPLIFRLVCSNGLIRSDEGLRQRHAGKVERTRIGVYSQETISQDDKAFWMKAVDQVRHMMRPETFHQITDRMRDTVEVRLTDPQKAVKDVTQRHDLTSLEHQRVFEHLLADGDLTEWGLVNAITRTAHDTEVVTSYERATELERLGGKLLDEFTSGKADRQKAA